MMQPTPQSCEADPTRDGPHQGPITQIDGYWLCERHEMLYNTDGIWLRGSPRKSDEGDNPWYTRS